MANGYITATMNGRISTFDGTLSGATVVRFHLKQIYLGIVYPIAPVMQLRLTILVEIAEHPVVLILRHTYTEYNTVLF